MDDNQFQEFISEMKKGLWRSFLAFWKKSWKDNISNPSKFIDLFTKNKIISSLATEETKEYITKNIEKLSIEHISELRELKIPAKEAVTEEKKHISEMVVDSVLLEKTSVSTPTQEPSNIVSDIINSPVEIDEEKYEKKDIDIAIDETIDKKRSRSRSPPQRTIDLVNQSIFIPNVPPSISNEDINKYFRDTPFYSHCSINKDRCGFLVFDDKNSRNSFFETHPSVVINNLSLSLSLNVPQLETTNYEDEKKKEVDNDDDPVTLFFGNLPLNIPVAELRKHIFDAIDNNHFEIDMKSGFAFVKFESHENLLKAKESLTNLKISDRPINVQSARNRNARKNVTYSVYIKGFPDNINESMLTNKFAKYGPIAKTSLFKDRGFAFIDYEKSDSMNDAIRSLHKTDWNGSELSVETAFRKGERRGGKSFRGSPRYGGYSNQQSGFRRRRSRSPPPYPPRHSYHQPQSYPPSTGVAFDRRSGQYVMMQPRFGVGAPPTQAPTRASYYPGFGNNPPPPVRGRYPDNRYRRH